MWKNSKTQNVTKLKNSQCDITKKKIKKGEKKEKKIDKTKNSHCEKKKLLT